MKREQARQARQLNPELVEEQPLFVELAQKPDGAAVTATEARKLISWVALLRRFRQAVAVFHALREAKAHPPALPDFKVSGSLGLKLQGSMHGLGEKAARQSLGIRRPVSPAAIKAEKIYTASVVVKQLPQFAPCVGSSQYCFRDGEKSPAESLDEKIALALQDPQLKPGAYLDALVMLAKRTSVVELAAVNTQLPVAQRVTKLPDACLVPKKEVTFLEDGMNEYGEVLRTFSDLEEVEWWVSQLNHGVQELVSQYQLRKALPVVPPEHPHVFFFGEKKGALYQFGQEIVKEWLAEFFREYRNKGQVPNNLSQWDAVGNTLVAKVDERPFGEELRHQLGQSTHDDFASLLGEKLTILFSAIRTDLAQGLSDSNVEERKSVIQELIQKAVESALADSLTTYAVQFIDPNLLVVPGTTMEILPGVAQLGLVYWRHRFESKWNALLKQEAQLDTAVIAAQVTDALFATSSVQKTIKGKTAYQPDRVAREKIEAHLDQTVSTLDEAARAQETIEYLRNLALWKANPLWSLVPGQSYEAAIARAAKDGVFDGTESACFYVPDEKGHGHGVSTFGNLNPSLDADYDHLKKGLISVAARHQKAIAKRLHEQYPDSVLRKAFAVADSATLAGLVLRKFEQTLEAEDSRDRGRVASIRRQAFAPLESWFKLPGSETWYKNLVEVRTKELFESELRPLLEMRPGEKATAEEKSAWVAYFDGRLKALFQSRFPLSKAPQAAEFLALYDAGGVGSSGESVAIAEALAFVAQQLTDRKFFEGRQPTPEAWVQLCQSQPDLCLGWVKTIEEQAAKEGFARLQSSRAADSASRILVSIFRGRPKSELQASELQRVAIGNWTLRSLPPSWGSEIDAKLAAAGEEEKKKLQPLSEAIKAHVAHRVEHAKASLQSIEAFLKSQDLSVARDALQWRKALNAYFAEHPEIHQRWSLLFSEFVQVLEKLIQSADATAYREAFAAFLVFLPFELRPLSSKETIASLDAVKSAPFHEKISQKFLPGYFEFRSRVLELIQQVTSPQTEVTAEILKLEKQTQKLADGLSLLEKQGKKDSSDAKQIAENAGKVREAREKALVRYDSLQRLKSLLLVLGADLPEAKPALEQLVQVKASDDLFQTLYADYREKKGKSGFSAAETLQDLNEIAAGTKGTLPVKASTARAYLQEIRNYCVAGRTDAEFIKTFEKSYSAVVNADQRESLFDTGARARMKNLARVPSKTKQTLWSLATGRVPSPKEFCSYVEKQSEVLEKRIESLRPDEETTAEWRVAYWKWVDLASGVFQSRSGAFGPFFQKSADHYLVRALKTAPTDSLSVPYSEDLALTGIAASALAEFLSQQPSSAVLAKVWPKEKIEDPAAWLNALSWQDQITRYLDLREFLRKTLIEGNEATDLFPKWVSLSQEKGETLTPEKWFASVKALSVLWSSIGDDTLSMSAKGEWKPLARELVDLLARGTLYRVQGDLLIAVKADADGQLLHATQTLVNSPSVESRNLARWANAAAAVLAHRETIADLPLSSLADNNAQLSPTALFYLNYSRLFARMPTAEEAGAPAIQWREEYMRRSLLGFHPYATQPTQFVDVWKPTGTVAEQSKQFEKWVDLVAGYGADSAFENLRKRKRTPGDRVRLWEKYSSFKELRASPSGEYQELVRFFARWDQNASATSKAQTYPAFLALLNWNLNHSEPDLSIGVSSPRQPLLESFLGHRLEAVVVELGLELDDFQSWRRVLAEKGQPEDWLVMAENKRNLLVNAGANRFFSTLIDAPTVKNPYWGATYHYRPFPLVSEKERTQAASNEDFGPWYSKTQDPRFTALSRVADSGRDRINGFEQMVADGLELQGTSTLGLGYRRSLFAEGRKDWNAFFAKVTAEAEKGFTEVQAAAIRSRSSKPLPSDKELRKIVREREALVALRAAASELLVHYGHENKHDLLRFDWFALENDLNAMVSAYAKQIEWSGKLPKIEVGAWRLEDRHRLGAGRAIYLASQLAYGQFFLGKSQQEQAQTEAVLTAADTYFRHQKQANTYTNMLLQVSQNIQKNLSALCAERKLISEIESPADFEKAEKRIWDLKLPLMDHLLEVAEELSPPGSSDAPRRMLQVMIAQHEKDKEDAEWWNQRIGMGSAVVFLGFIVATRHPALARMAATTPHWAIRVGTAWGPRAVGWGFGGWFGYRLYSDVQEDFVTAPKNLADFNQIRDSQFQGILPLMSDETASMRDGATQALAQRQMSTGVWVQRLIEAALAVDMLGAPILRWLTRVPQRLMQASRRGWTAEKRFYEVTESEARAKLAKIGTDFKSFEGLSAVEAEARISMKELDALQKRMKAWEADGELVPPQPVVDALLADVRMQVQSSARIAEIDAVSMRSLNAAPSAELLAYQSKVLNQLRYLKDIEGKLTSSVPHINADDLRVLFAQSGNPMVRHRPWYLQVIGIPTLSPAARLLKGIWEISKSGNDANKALSFYLTSKWVTKNREHLKTVANSMDNISEAELLDQILKEEIFVKTKAQKVFGESAKVLEDSASELRSLIKLGGVQPDKALAEALATENFESLSVLFARSENTAVVGQAALERLKPATKAPAALVPIEAPAAEAVIEFEMPVHSVTKFDVYAAFLRGKLPTQVGGVRVEPEEILRLAQQHTSQDIQGLLGRHFRVRGLEIDPMVAELRIAAEIRRGIEFDLAGKKRVFEELYQIHLSDFKKLVARDLSIAEAKSIVGFDPMRVTWSTSDVVWSVDHLAGAVDRAAVDEAARLLSAFSPAERRLVRPQDLLRALDLAPEYLHLSASAERWAQHQGSLQVGKWLTHPEFMQLNGLFSRVAPTYSGEAQSILGMSLRGATEATVHARAKALRESLQGMELPVLRVNEAEALLLKELGH